MPAAIHNDFRTRDSLRPDTDILASTSCNRHRTPGGLQLLKHSLHPRRTPALRRVQIRLLTGVFRKIEQLSRLAMVRRPKRRWLAICAIILPGWMVDIDPVAIPNRKLAIPALVDGRDLASPARAAAEGWKHIDAILARIVWNRTADDARNRRKDVGVAERLGCRGAGWKFGRPFGDERDAVTTFPKVALDTAEAAAGALCAAPGVAAAAAVAQVRGVTKDEILLGSHIDLSMLEALAEASVSLEDKQYLTDALALPNLAPRSRQWWIDLLLRRLERRLHEEKHGPGSYRFSMPGSAADPDELATAADQEAARAASARRLLEQAGHPCRIVSIGSTPTALAADRLDGVTEVRAGVYVFFDLVMHNIGVCTASEIALSVLTTVIGHQPDKGWIITDAGWMAMSRDRGTQRQRQDFGYGQVCSEAGVWLEGARVTGANQEHGIVGFDPAKPGAGAPPADVVQALPVGTRLRILPNHACATGAQFPAYQALAADGSVQTWERLHGW